MSSDDNKTKDELHQGDLVDVHESEKADILDSPDLLNEAFDGENREHEEGVWQSAKNHPWACLWAFLMCFTIVSQVPLIRVHSPTPASSCRSTCPFFIAATDAQ